MDHGCVSYGLKSVESADLSRFSVSRRNLTAAQCGGCCGCLPPCWFSSAPWMCGTSSGSLLWSCEPGASLKSVDITAEQTLTGRVSPHDIDMCHMNNARYLRECDFARFSLYIRNGVFKGLRALKASMVVGATTIRYRRALCIGEGFELRSRIVTWDDKAFYLEQRFVSTKDGLVCAVMYCKQSIIRSSPDKIMQHLCKRKVDCPEFPEDLQHWVNFISASSQALRAESGLEEKSK
ncbi:hypothetical protein F7725_011302 [Dissostichus mawsoni]|uniref:Protein THEM6 n=1 Tax=Dissostichus mawsoni TaxID=36200 RepID=A0A7J5ZAB9_DISMA|nr:hypothetical protein F7725_011302 [Dissostichus mawsoni]